MSEAEKSPDVTPEAKLVEDATIAEIGKMMDGPDDRVSSWYKLVDRVPVPIKFSDMLRELQAARDPNGGQDQYQDLREKLGYWARVKETYLGPGDRVWVSTVFLGVDHSFRFDKDVPYAPVVFETMVFTNGVSGLDEIDGDMDRYCTWGEAEAGHDVMVEKARKIIAAKYTIRARIRCWVKKPFVWLRNKARNIKWA